MGLDQYIYRIKKTNAKDIKRLKDQNIDQIERLIGPDTMAIYQNSMLNNPDKFKDIKHLCTKVNMIIDYVNIKQVRKDYDIPDTWIDTGFSANDKRYRYCFGGPTYNNIKAKDVELTLDEIKNKYLLHENEDTYVCDLIREYYMRNENDINDILCDIYLEDTGNDILNCGYHKMTPRMIEFINRSQQLNFNEQDELFYHVWF